MKYFRLLRNQKLMQLVSVLFKIKLKNKKKFPELIIVSKVENSEGLKNVEEISKFSDAIMIDRDLSAEIENNNLYDGINKISKYCKIWQTS